MTKVRWRLASITALICAAAVWFAFQPVGTVIAEDQPAKAQPSAGNDESAGESAVDSGETTADKGTSSASKKKPRREVAPKKKTTKTAKQPAGARPRTSQPGMSGGGRLPVGGTGGNGTRPSAGGSSAGGNSSANPNSTPSDEVDSDDQSGGGTGRDGGKEGPAVPGDMPYPPEVQKVMDVQEKHTEDLLKQEGIVGTSTALSKDGKIVIKVYMTGAGNPQVPAKLDGIPVEKVLSGLIRPFDGSAGSPQYNPRVRQKRPVPIGISAFNEENPVCGGSSCFAGTLGVRLKAKDGSGLYALSNSHVFSNEGNAPIGTTIVSPSPGEVNCACVPEDIIGKLARFKPLNVSGGFNLMDAAIISTSEKLVGNSTLPDGYGVPRTYTIKNPQLGMRVQKYGRTTGFTKGRVTAINAITAIGYTIGVARFRRQVEFFGEPGKIFGDHGDSGSLIVTEDRFPIALLYGGDDVTHVVFGNPIQAVLDEFGMEIDGDDSLDFPIPGKSGRTAPGTP